MSRTEINVEFGICEFENEKLETEEHGKPVEITEDVLETQAEIIRTGNLYFDEHRPESKHIPFLLTSYSVNMPSITTVLLGKWRLPSPRIILLALSGSDDAPSEKYRKISKKLVKGLVYALNTTEMWFCTDGLDHGFSRDISKAFEREHSRRKTTTKGYHKDNVSAFPDTALIGICKPDNLSFSEKLEVENSVSDQMKSATKEHELKENINNRCGYFIFVKDNTKFENGVTQFYLNFTDYLSKNLLIKRRTEAIIQTNRFAVRICETPVMAILMHGKISDINFIVGHLKNGLPLVVFEGSGGLADLIAYANYQYACKPAGINVAEYTEAVLKPQISERINRAFPDLSEWHITERILTEKIFDCIRYSKQQDQMFLTVLNLSDIGYNPADLPSHLLKALFKSQSSDIIRNAQQMKKDLFLAMDWNSPGVAMTEVFARDSTNSFQIDNETFFRALTKPHREDFVSLFLSQGFVVHTFLDSLTLLELFQSSLSREFFRSVVWESVLGFGSNDELTRKFLDNKLIVLLYELTGVPTLINTKELDWNSRKVYDKLSAEEAERKAIAVLAFWAVLSYHTNLVKVLWRHSEQPVQLALTCSIILRKLETHVTDLSLRNEMEKVSKEFSEMASNIMTECYKNTPARAIDLLCEKNPVWSHKSVVEIAAYAKNRAFLSHACVQKYLDNLFMGQIIIRDLPYGEIRCPQWLKIIFSTLFFWPMFLWIRFEVPDESKSAVKPKSEEKLKERPRYRESITLGKFQQKDFVSYRKEEKMADPWFWKKVYYLWSAPISKFWVSQVFYMMFLSVFSLAVVWPACGSLYLDFITCIWIAIIIVDSACHTYSLNKKYASLPLTFKCIEMLFMFIFLVAYIMSRLLYYHAYISPYHAKIMLCIALLYFYYRWIFAAFPISSDLGPMLYRIKRMIVVDFYGYIRVAMLVIISNAIVIHAIIYPDFPLSWDMFRRAIYDAIISFFLTPADHFGVPSSKCIKLIRHPNRHSFLGVDEKECKVGKFLLPSCPNPGIWPYIFGLQYLIFLKLILMVMLFALFSNTHNKLQAEGTYIWKYQRYELVVNFCNRTILPPPFCIFTYAYNLLKTIYKIITNKNDKEEEDQMSLDEYDYTYWKSLASDYKDLKNDHEISTEKRMERVNVLVNKLNQQRETLRDLQGYLTELQILIVNAHQHLEAGGLSMSVRERLEEQHVPQIFSRVSPYPGTKILRFPVSENHVPWSCMWTIYDPIAYTMPKDDFPTDMKEHVDTDIQLKRELEGEEFTMPSFKWNEISVSPAGVFVDRTTWIMKDKQDRSISYDIDAEGLPMNPMGRTGLRGRGRLPRWGPNHYMYVVITRWLEDPEVTRHKYLEVVLLRSDDGIWLPGGFVPEENIYGPIWNLFENGIVWRDQSDMVNFFIPLKAEDVYKHSTLERKTSKEILKDRLKIPASDETVKEDGTSLSTGAGSEKENSAEEDNGKPTEVESPGEENPAPEETEVGGWTSFFTGGGTAKKKPVEEKKEEPTETESPEKEKPALDETEKGGSIGFFTGGGSGKEEDTAKTTETETPEEETPASDETEKGGFTSTFTGGGSEEQKSVDEDNGKPTKTESPEEEIPVMKPRSVERKASEKVSKTLLKIFPRRKSEALIDAEVYQDDYLQCEIIKRGYLDEETNTDQAWCEAEVWHFHYKKGCKIEEKFKASMFWILLNESVLVKVPIGQAALMHQVAKKLKAVIEVL